MTTHHVNYALVNQDVTSCFEDEIMRLQINPFARKLFRDILESLNVKNRR